MMCAKLGNSVAWGGTSQTPLGLAGSISVTLPSRLSTRSTVDSLYDCSRAAYLLAPEMYGTVLNSLEQEQLAQAEGRAGTES